MRTHKYGTLLLALIVVGASAVPLFGHVSVNPRTTEGRDSPQGLFHSGTGGKEHPGGRVGDGSVSGMAR